MDETFGTRLVDRVRDLGPLCVGVDPSSAQLISWGRDDDAGGLEFAALATLEAAVGVAAAIKAQVSFFERFGSRGVAVLERLIGDARSAGILVIADAKRGDIGSTNDGYAQAWLSPGSPLGVDALTLSPYLGLGAMSALVEFAGRSARGAFVVAASSNPEGRDIQLARTASGERVEDLILRQVAEFNEASAGLGGLGAVVGATRDRPEFDLTKVRGPFLVPGVGAQGASVDDVAQLFGTCHPGSVLVNISRAISSAGPERRALRDAAQRWRDDLHGALP
jgi:orotidine-5'-phosphate decarboxylase